MDGWREGWEDGWSKGGRNVKRDRWMEGEIEQGGEGVVG